MILVLHCIIHSRNELTMLWKCSAIASLVASFSQLRFNSLRSSHTDALSRLDSILNAEEISLRHGRFRICNTMLERSCQSEGVEYLRL